jgi:hypothetical protein
MKNVLWFSFTFLFLFSLFTLPSCSEEQVINPQSTTTTKQEFCDDTTSVKDSLKKEIEPMGYLCGTWDRVMWVPDKYIAYPGVKIGILLYPEFTMSDDDWKDLYRKYGFNMITIHDLNQANYFKTLGFKQDSLMAIVNRDNGNIPSGTYKYYFIDEPVEHDKDALVLALSQYLLQINPAAILSMSSYTSSTSRYNMILNSRPNTRMMCDNYFDWDLINWCEDDQRSWWTTFQDDYSSRNYAHWVSLIHDDMEFRDLFGHASNLGLNTMWVYAGGNEPATCVPQGTLTREIYESHLHHLMSGAWQAGWVRRFERKYIYEYRCSLPNPCDCVRDNPNGWYLYKKWPFNEWREVYPDPIN